jgi:hypothetical protein
MILESIHDGTCVPFLGAAANITNQARKYNGLPLGPEVALRLIGKLIGAPVQHAKELAEVKVVSQAFAQQRLHEDLAKLWVQNLPRVALHVEVQGNDRPFLNGTLKEILSDQNCQPSQLLTTLAALPISLIVTTNYDSLLERAVETAQDTSWSLKASDIVAPKTFVLKVRDGNDAVSQYLRGQLSAPTQQEMAAYDGVNDPPAGLLASLATDLDAVIHAPGLYDEQRFVAVHYSEETRKLRAAAENLRFNRLLLEDAYPKQLARSRKPYQLVIQPVEGFTDDEGRSLQDNPPADDVLVIYKIHGSFSGAAAAHAAGAGVVITEDDYIQFLTVINETIRGVPTHIVSRLTRSTVLFLGYSLDDWDFRTLHKALVEQRLSKHQRRAAFAIQWQPPQFWVDFWKSKNVVIYDCDIYDFAEDLETRYIEKYGSLAARKTPTV